MEADVSDEREKLSCSDCGVEMNLHAEKIDYALVPQDEGASDEWPGGALEEFHTCPACGRTSTRRAE